MRNLGFPDERRGRAGEAVSQEVTEPSVDVTEDAEHVYLTVELPEGEVELVVEPAKVHFLSSALTRRLEVALPAIVTSEGLVRSTRNGIVDVVLRKVLPLAKPA